MPRPTPAFLGRSSLIFTLVLIVFGLATARQAHCASYPLGGGTLNYEYVSTGERSCTNQQTHANTEYPVYIFDNFSYTYNGITYPLTITNQSGGEVVWWQPVEFCVAGPPIYTTEYIIPETELCTVTLSPYQSAINASESCEAAQNGYINPKYIVVDVIYAPPGGAQPTSAYSYVSYLNSTTVGSTQQVVNTSTQSQTVTASTTAGATLFGFLGGSKQEQSSTTLTQTSQDTQSVTLTDTNTNILNVYAQGTDDECDAVANTYMGLDHDCDTIRVWLNPVVLFSIYGNTVVWDGYGYDEADAIAPIHIDSVKVGCLNGALPKTSSVCEPLFSETSGSGDVTRSWAANENWPSGQGPGLTATDLANILAADTWGNCTPTSPIGSSACPTYTSPGFSLSPPHFYLSDQTNVSFAQSGGETTYQVLTANSSMEGEATTTTKSQTYGYVDAFTGTAFLANIGTSVGFSQTFTTSNEVNDQTTKGNMAIGSAYIWGPPCAGDPCSPSYPPASPYYGQGTSFDIFTDQLYGTFVFVPSDYE